MGAIGAVVACHRLWSDVIVSLSDFHRGFRLCPSPSCSLWNMISMTLPLVMIYFRGNLLYNTFWVLVRQIRDLMTVDLALINGVYNWYELRIYKYSLHMRNKCFTWLLHLYVVALTCQVQSPLVKLFRPQNKLASCVKFHFQLISLLI